VRKSGAATPAIQIDNLTVRYPGAPSPALHGVTLQVARGARDALVGANGSGKSTLLKAIVRLVPWQSGSISLQGEGLDANRAGLAYLPQIGELDWRFPIEVRRLILTGRYVHLGWLRRPRPRDRALVDAALERLGLQSVAGRQIGQISGGQRQRALLARALVQEADTLLLDEPFNAVDAESRDIVLEVLDDLRAQGKTVVLATHDLERMNVDPDQVHALVDGRLADNT